MDLWSVKPSAIRREVTKLYPGARVSPLTTGLWVYAKLPTGEHIQVSDYQLRFTLDDLRKR